MKFNKFLYLAAAMLLVACGSENPDDEENKDDQPSQTQPENPSQEQNPQDPSQNPPTTDPDKPDPEKKPLLFEPDSYWRTDAGDELILMNKDSAQLLTRNKAVAQIYHGHLLWIFDPNGHEGFSQNFEVSCDKEACTLELSEFMEDWDAAKKPGAEKLVLKPSENALVFPETIVSTILSDYPQGRYFRGNAADYSAYSPNAMPSGLTIDATLVVETDKWAQGFSFIEKLNDEEYLVHANNTADTPFPSSNSQKKWFTTFRLKKGKTTPCSSCQCTEYEWAISDTWRNYRDPVKLHREYNTYSGTVFYVEQDSCHLTDVPELPFTKITVQDDKKGNWDWYVTGNTEEPYDSRKLQYLEMLDYDGKSWRAIYTYALVYKWDTSDPERFGFDRYFQIAKFTPAENGCFTIDTTDLSENGIFGLDLDAELPMHFTACNPVKEEKPDPGTDPDPDPGTNPDPGTDPDPGTTPEPETPSEFFQSDFKSQRTTTEGIWTLWSKSDVLSGSFNGEAFAMKILYKADNAANSETAHAHYYLVEVQPGHKWSGLTEGMITAIELYFYEKSDKTPEPYLKFMYPAEFPTLTKETTDFSSISFKKALNNFMIE